MNEHDFQPVEVDGKTIPQCSRCGHRWYGKGEAKKPCVDTITVTINGRAVVYWCQPPGVRRSLQPHDQLTPSMD